MSYTIKNLAELKGTILTAQEVKDHSLNEYNKAEWIKTVNRYLSYSDCIFILVEGANYPTIYVQYITDGIRFLGQVSYSSCLSGGGFAWGSITTDGTNALIRVMCYEEGRISTDGQGRKYMRDTTKLIDWKFFTKQF